MNDNFLFQKAVRRKTQGKRKAETNNHQSEKKRKFIPDLDEEITSEEEEDYKNKKTNEEEEEEFEDETAQEKKVRLARQYLKELQEQSKYIAFCSWFVFDGILL